MTARHILTPLDRVMRERDEAREALARVEALIEGWERGNRPFGWDYRNVASRIRDALAGTDPTDTEGDDRD